MDDLDYLETDFEMAEYFFNGMVARATGDQFDPRDYQQLRDYFLGQKRTKDLVPKWIRTNRNVGHYWEYIKNKFQTYAERREFLNNEFDPLLSFLESNESFPAEKSIT